MTNGCRSTRNRILVVSTTRPERVKENTIFVGTPLDLISMLEQDREQISTVVLAGRFATNRELTTFLTDTYPALSVVSSRVGEEPDTYLPTYS